MARPGMRGMALAAFALAGALGGLPAAADADDDATRILLVGDSTVADDSGWGPALCARVRDAACVNLAKGGRSTKSYREEGSWDDALARVADAPTDTWVLIQFGHNDQPGKPGRSTELTEEFPRRLTDYIVDLRAAGAHPVLLTPLTRRQFRDGRLLEDLAPWAGMTRRVAAELGVPLVDLNALSVARVQALGPVRASALAMAPAPAEVLEAAGTGTTIEAPKRGPEPHFDYTHLGEEGAGQFGDMVARELAARVPPLAEHLDVELR